MMIIERDGTRRQLGDGEIIPDGARTIVPTMLMDGRRTELFDARGDPAGHRVGYVFTRSLAELADAAEERRAATRDAYRARLRDAWKSQPKDQASEYDHPRAPALDDLESAYARRSERVQNAWKHPRRG